MAYWLALEHIPLRWAQSDLNRIPQPWLSFGPRKSPISVEGNARHAAFPSHALLNYLYAVLETQTRRALQAEGFDLTCGFLHRDRPRPSRESLVYDLIELERPSIDDLLLDFLSTTTLHYVDALRDTDGTIRLHQQLKRAAIAACRVPQERINGHARWLHDLLLK